MVSNVSRVLKPDETLALVFEKVLETSAQMKIAMESCGGIAGVKAVLCGLQPSVDLRVKWEGVSFLNNVEYDTKDIKVWRAFRVGPEKFLPWSSFDQAQQLPQLNKIAAPDESTTSSFVAIKARKRPSFPKTSAKVLPMGWALKSSAKRKRFMNTQKKYLIEAFQTGERTGEKSNPSLVSKAMRTGFPFIFS